MIAVRDMRTSLYGALFGKMESAFNRYFLKFLQSPGERETMKDGKLERGEEWREEKRERVVVNIGDHDRSIPVLCMNNRFGVAWSIWLCARL